MSIEFREVRRGEIDDALTFATSQGASIEASALQPQLSLVAINAEQTTLGSALHHVDADGRHHIAVHLTPDINPGLARLLIDRALRKAEAADLSTTHVQIDHAQADADTWKGANWLSRLGPTTRPAEQTTKAAETTGPIKPDESAVDQAEDQVEPEIQSEAEEQITPPPSDPPAAAQPDATPSAEAADPQAA